VLFLLALFAFVLVFLDSDGFRWKIGFGEMSTINLVLSVWLAAAVLTLGLLAFTVLAWIKRYWGRVSRIHYTLVTLAAVTFVWFLNYWNLLGFQY
jgi:uncharacterized membrane protein YuzA (DUF378 family)